MQGQNGREIADVQQHNQHTADNLGPWKEHWPSKQRTGRDELAVKSNDEARELTADE